MEDDTPDYEQISYGKFGYKRVQRLRRKGKRRGIEVPQLNYALTKPEKPRIAFWVAAIIGIIAFIAILVGAGFLIKFIIDVFSDLYKDTGGFFKTVIHPGTLFATQGLSLVPVLFLILAYLALISIAVVPLVIALSCFRFVRNMLYTARCSKEEFARGERISGNITGAIGILVGATVVMIVIFVMTDAHTARLLVGLIYGAIVIIAGGFLALMIIERKKCKKWFEGLEEDNKRNFIEHDNGLRRIKSRLHFERQLLFGWNR